VKKKKGFYLKKLKGGGEQVGFPSSGKRLRKEGPYLHLLMGRERHSSIGRMGFKCALTRRPEREGGITSLWRGGKKIGKKPLFRRGAARRGMEEKKERRKSTIYQPLRGGRL